MFFLIYKYVYSKTDLVCDVYFIVATYNYWVFFFVFPSFCCANAFQNYFIVYLFIDEI